MKIAIVHYHLQRGGVTRVIENAIAALGDRAEIAVFSGESVPESGVEIPNVTVVPGLGYCNSGTEVDAANLAEALIRVSRDVFGKMGPDVWHIHNHSLGKNVLIPSVVSRLAEKGARMLLQIHDFAEDGRPENYRRQRDFSGDGGWFPAAPQIHYAVLNSRDAEFLGRAGLDESRLHLLANPVSALPVDSNPESRPFAEGKQFLLYPTRGIRRKNVGELLLLAALTRNRFEFATTLAPENPEWQPIHDRWVSFAREHRLPVHLGMAEGSAYGFGQLIGWSDALITTSVAEGFGLAFLEPWLAGKSVVGRNLPEITADFVSEGLEIASLYPALRVPADWVDLPTFRTRLREAIGNSYRQYGRVMPSGAVERAWDVSVRDGKVDFGILDEPLQERVIERALGVRGDAGIDPLLKPVSADRIAGNAEVVRENFSIQRYGERLFAVYERIAGAVSGEPAQLDGEALLDAYLDPARFCLLRS